MFHYVTSIVETLTVNLKEFTSVAWVWARIEYLKAKTIVIAATWRQCLDKSEKNANISLAGQLTSASLLSVLFYSSLGGLLSTCAVNGAYCFRICIYEYILPVMETFTLSISLWRTVKDIQRSSCCLCRFRLLPHVTSFIDHMGLLRCVLLCFFPL